MVAILQTANKKTRMSAEIKNEKIFLRPALVAFMTWSHFQRPDRSRESGGVGCACQ